MPDGSPWPRVSIVTPSYNQGPYIEETIRSVLLQGYPNLETIIIDGGSTDGSAEIIRKYEPWLAYWVSEKDRGQSHAINKGWARATGDVVAYLNSDDFYLPGALHRAVDALLCQPACALVYADVYWVNELGKPFGVGRSRPFDLQQMLTGRASCWIPQPTAFMRREAVQAVGGVDEALHMAMDFDLWIKLLLRYPGHYVPGKPLAAARVYAGTKTRTRVIEHRLEALLVLDRALADPLCPPGVTRVNSRQYLGAWLDLAGFYLVERRDLRSAVSYFVSAVRYQPIGTVRYVSRGLALRVYRAITPPTWQAQLRHMRGTQPSEVVEAWN
jgi:glycosyltransferase involved in cell wall biosynthesis